MQTWNEEQLERLRPHYPDWDLWIVPLYCGGTTWCAKPKGVRCATINVGSPEELVEAIAEQSVTSR